MNPEHEIKNAQMKWATSRGIAFDLRGSGGYVRDVQCNLRVPLSSHAQSDYEAGAGKELKGHMRALHSSSALAVNFFDYWNHWGDKHQLLEALEVSSGKVIAFDFEKKFHTEISQEDRRRKPPHLDVAIKLDSNRTIAIESKFTEWMGRSTVGKSDFKPAYFPHSSGRWAKQHLLDCQEFAEELHDNRCRFEFLDPWQLLKHALGLATELTHQFSLYYLYYDWPSWESEQHEREIEDFCARVGEELNFKHLSYQEIYHRLADSLKGDGFHAAYLDYLRNRYFCGKGAPRD